MRTYTQMLLCFPLAQHVDRSNIVAVLERAAAALLDAIPILAGQVVNHKEGSNDASTSGIFQVIPYSHPNGSPVKVKYLDDFTSYENFRGAGAPASMLDATVLAPMKGFPEHYSDTDVTPVFIVQANFIPGGLLLCCAGMHNVMDATGLGQVVRMFATLCRGAALSADDVSAATLDRAYLPIALKPTQSPMSHPELAPKPGPATPTNAENVPTSVWSYINISASKLRSLKAECLRDLASDIAWVSTNDAVTAWFWRTITEARRSRVNTEKDTTLLRAISGRQVLDPPLLGNYLGNVVICASCKLNMTSLIERPLSSSAQAVRKATNKIDDHYVRSFASLISMEPDRNKISFSMNDPDHDFLISSWTSLPVYEDFGNVIGQPEFVRRPTSPPWTNVCYIMPKRPDGSFDLLVSLREDDMLRLRENEQFAAVAEYLG